MDNSKKSEFSKFVKLGNQEDSYSENSSYDSVSADSVSNNRGSDKVSIQKDLDKRLRGNWTFRCDDEERNSDGLTEADIVWIEMNKLLEKKPSLFVLKRSRSPTKENYRTINTYTPDYRDEEFVLKIVEFLRKNIYFPYILYYFESKPNSESIYMHTPNGEFYRKTKNKNWEVVNRN